MPARRQRWRWAWSGSWWSSGTSRGRAETRKAGPADGPSDDEESHGKTRSGSYATSPQATHAHRPGTLPTADSALVVGGVIGVAGRHGIGCSGCALAGSAG